MAGPDLGQLTREEYDKLPPEEKQRADAMAQQAQQIADATPPPTNAVPSAEQQQALFQRYQEAQQGGTPLTPQETQQIQQLQQLAAAQQQAQYETAQQQQAMAGNEDNKAATEQKPEFWKTIKEMSTWDYIKLGGVGLGAAALTGGGSLLAGLANAGTTMGSYIAANYLVNRKEKTKMDKDQIRREGYIGAAMTPILYEMFKGIGSIANPYLRTLTGLGVAVPAFNAAFWPVRHLINNYTPGKLLKRIFKKDEKKGSIFKEIYDEALKPNFFDSWKKTAMYLGIPIHFVWNYLPLQYQLPATAGTRTLYKYVMEQSAKKDPKEYSTEQTQKVMPGYSPN